MTLAEPVARPTADDGPRRARVRLPGWPFAAALYAVASVALHHRVLADLDHRATGWVSADSSLFTWWLRWTPFAVGHGQDPLLTTWIGAPAGVNALWNTSVPVLGALLAPITLTAGPTAAFNVGMMLGPVASALACYLALGAWVRSRPARTLGGALYGFGPFVVAHGAVGHLNLVWAVLPPVLLWAVRAILVEQRHPWRDGALLGLAIALQMGLYTQTVALGAVVVLVVAVVLAVRWPGQVLPRLPALGRSLLATLAMVGAICAYPLWLLLAGPSRPQGQIRAPETASTDLAALVAPPPSLALPLGWEDLGARLAAVLPSEASAYLGIPLLVVCVATVLLVRSPPVRVVAVGGLVALVVSLGPRLRLAGTDTGVPLPGTWLHAVPLVGQAEPVRYGVFVALAVAVLVAVAVDRALRAPPRVRIPLVMGLLAAAATWIPADALEATDASSPAFFAAGAPGLSTADVVATVPRATVAWVGGARPMLWQADAGMAYRQVGGYFIGSAPGRPVLLEAEASAFDTLGGDPAAARRDLDRLGVTVVLVVPQPDVDVPAAVRWTRQVTGVPGEVRDGVWVFRR
ncbi:hypothetical protein [Actinomycetospora flava]|uniref:Glycosyl transferase n=1 Tax=Actinomycetospora flava TaxID=3129232 RepID=A0ABU8MA82_9PSEU